MNWLGNINRSLLILVVALVLVGLCLPYEAQAQAAHGRFINNNVAQVGGIFAATGLQNTTLKCLDQAPAGSGISSAEWRKKYSARFVYCMRNLLEKASRAYLESPDGLIAKLEPALAAVILFSMILFGIKLTAGMLRNPKAEAAVYLIKISVVLGLYYSSAELVTFFFDLTDELLNLVASGTKTVFDSQASAAYGNLSFCAANAPSSGSLQEWIGIWDRFDCFFQKILGFGDVKLSATILSIVGSVVLSGIIGLYLFFAAIGAFIALLLFLFKTIATVLFSYGGLAMLMLLLPIYAPFLLFNKFERWMTEKWIGIAAGNVLVPAFAITFLFFAVTALDIMLNFGSVSTYSSYSYDAANKRYEYNTFTLRDNGNSISGSATGAPIIPPAGYKPPAGYVKTIAPLYELLGVKSNDNNDEKTKKILGSIKSQLADDNVVKPNRDPSFLAHFENYCGKLGKMKLSDGSIDAEYLKSNAPEQQFTDPQAGRDAIKAGMPNALSGNNISARTTMCDWGTTGGNINDVTSLIKREAKLNKPLLQMSKVDLESNSKNTSAYDDAISPLNTTKSKIMRMATTLLAFFLLGGAFHSFSKQIPNAVSSVVNTRVAKMSLPSPKLGDASLMDRLSGGLRNMKSAMQKNTKKGGMLTDLLAGKNPKNSASSFFKMITSGVRGFIGGAMESDAANFKRWASNEIDYDNLGLGGLRKVVSMADKAASGGNRRAIKDMEEELQSLLDDFTKYQQQGDSTTRTEENDKKEEDTSDNVAPSPEEGYQSSDYGNMYDSGTGSTYKARPTKETETEEVTETGYDSYNTEEPAYEEYAQQVPIGGASSDSDDEDAPSGVGYTDLESDSISNSDTGTSGETDSDIGSNSGNNSNSDSSDSSANTTQNSQTATGNIPNSNSDSSTGSKPGQQTANKQGQTTQNDSGNTQQNDTLELKPLPDSNDTLELRELEKNVVYAANTGNRQNVSSAPSGNVAPKQTSNPQTATHSSTMTDNISPSPAAAAAQQPRSISQKHADITDNIADRTYHADSTSSTTFTQSTTYAPAQKPAHHKQPVTDKRNYKEMPKKPDNAADKTRNVIKNNITDRDK